MTERELIKEAVDVLTRETSMDPAWWGSWLLRATEALAKANDHRLVRTGVRGQVSGDRTSVRRPDCKKGR